MDGKSKTFITRTDVTERLVKLVRKDKENAGSLSIAALKRRQELVDIDRQLRATRQDTLKKHEDLDIREKALLHRQAAFSKKVKRYYQYISDCVSKRDTALNNIQNLERSSILDEEKIDGYRYKIENAKKSLSSLIKHVDMIAKYIRFLSSVVEVEPLFGVPEDVLERYETLRLTWKSLWRGENAARVRVRNAQQQLHELEKTCAKEKTEFQKTKTLGVARYLEEEEKAEVKKAQMSEMTAKTADNATTVCRIHSAVDNMLSRSTIKLSHVHVVSTDKVGILCDNIQYIEALIGKTIEVEKDILASPSKKIPGKTKPGRK
ncbi:hypothetical protein ADUPG1_000524 [Aduncisulcus paluster]|uniref:DUF4200 domain-containing protein n=1 Tax=Aduncisulcus paluster TaxID=2918883 RepID=A0ABQ5K6P4_9EUKA|nr:hypothetical protein ADUPG1_000524 [Aduncisulcus paluster]